MHAHALCATEMSASWRKHLALCRCLYKESPRLSRMKRYSLSSSRNTHDSIENIRKYYHLQRHARPGGCASPCCAWAAYGGNFAFIIERRPCMSKRLSEIIARRRRGGGRRGQHREVSSRGGDVSYLCPSPPSSIIKRSLIILFLSRRSGENLQSR